MAKTLSKIESIGILQQDKSVNHWDVIAADNAAFKTVQWINVGTLIPDPAVTVDNFNVTSRLGIHHEDERFFIDATSGLPTLPFAGTCDKTTMAAFLVAALQACSEAVLTPFEKTITAAGLSTVVNWAGNEGYLFTLALKQGASADDGILIHNALIDTLNIVWEVETNGIARLVNMNGTWVGSKIEYEQTLNGTWVNATAAQTGFFNNTDTWSNNFGGALLNIGGVDYSAKCIRRVEIQINNNIRKACVSTGGVATNYVSSPEYKIMFTLDHDSDTEKIHYDFVQGTTFTMNWSNDAADAGTDGKWSIVIPNAHIMSVPKNYAEEYIGISIDGRLYSASGVSPITIYFTDTIDWAF